MFPPAGPGGCPQLLRVLRAEPGGPGGCRGRGRLHGHGGLEGLGPGAVNSNNDLIILYASINCVCLKLVMWLCYDEVKPFSLYNSFFHLWLMDVMQQLKLMVCHFSHMIHDSWCNIHLTSIKRWDLYLLYSLHFPLYLFFTDYQHLTNILHARWWQKSFLQ